MANLYVTLFFNVALKGFGELQTVEFHVSNMPIHGNYKK